MASIDIRALTLFFTSKKDDTANIAANASDIMFQIIMGQLSRLIALTIFLSRGIFAYKKALKIRINTYLLTEGVARSQPSCLFLIQEKINEPP